MISFDFLLKPKIQFLLIIITSIFIVFTANLKISRYEFFDFTPGIIVGESKNKDIQVFINLQNFTKSDFSANEFIVDLSIWFAYDPEKISADDISKFNFSKGEVLEKNEHVLGKIDGKSIVRYDVRIKFVSNLNYKYFPLDSHRLSIVLDNKFLNGADVSFDIPQGSFFVSPTIYAPAWHFIGSDVRTGHKELKSIFDTVSYPRAVLSLDFLQDSVRNFIFIFLPLLIMLLVSLCAFALNLRVHFATVLTLTSTSVLGMLGYRYVIEKMSPKVSYYMLSDHIFTLILVILFAIFFLDIFYRQKLDEYRGALVGFFYLVIYGLWIYLLFLW